MKNETKDLHSLVRLIACALIGAATGLAFGFGFGFFTGSGFFGSYAQVIASQSTMSIMGMFLGLISGILLGIRYKNLINLKNLGSLFLTLFFSVTTCTIIGLIVGIGAVYFQEKGVFVSWKLLGNPVEFTHIVDANTSMIWAQSADSKLYSWNSNCFIDPKCNRWVEIESIPENVQDVLGSTIRGDTCQLKANHEPKNQPGNITECVLARSAMYETSWTTYYALLDDGTIWSWNYDFTLYSFMFTPMFFVLIGTLVGVIGGMSVFLRKRRVKKRE